MAKHQSLLTQNERAEYEAEKCISLYLEQQHEFILPHILFRYADVVTQTFALLGHTLYLKDTFVQKLKSRKKNHLDYLINEWKMINKRLTNDKQTADKYKQTADKCKQTAYNGLVWIQQF